MKNHLFPVLLFVVLFTVPLPLVASSGNNVSTAREVITLLNTGKFKEVISKFDSTMKKVAPEQRLNALWTSLVKQTGKFQKELGDTTLNIRGYDMVVVTCKFEKSEQDIKLVFDKEGKIAGLFFAPHRETVVPAEKLKADSTKTPVPVKKMEGRWEGKLKAGKQTLRVVFRLSLNKGGGLTALLDSPDQGATGIHVDTVVLNGNRIRMVISAGHAMYTGEVNTDSGMIVGDWTQWGETLPLTLKKQTGPMKTTQSEIPPVTYVSRNVTFENKGADVTLAGTLTMPDSTGVFPAVLLIDGSGPHDRDETLFGHKPFLVLADYLTRHGIAVLRYDKRGVGQSTGDYATATTMDFASDALAGVNYLMTLKEVDKKEIGLIGHSEGGEIAPIVADESHNVAFIVMMAGPGVPGYKVILSQLALIDKASGAGAKSIDSTLVLERKLLKIAMSEKDSVNAAAKLKAILEKEGHKSAAAAKMYVSVLLSPWYREFLSYNPRLALERVKCPVLALWGSKDIQVPPSRNMPAVRKALEKGGNRHFKLMELQGLNHLFQKAKTGSLAEYRTIKEAIDPEALDVITNWILKETGDRG